MCLSLSLSLGVVSHMGLARDGRVSVVMESEWMRGMKWDLGFWDFEGLP
jgi:hypothetical protein